MTCRVFGCRMPFVVTIRVMCLTIFARQAHELLTEHSLTLAICREYNWSRVVGMRILRLEAMGETASCRVGIAPSCKLNLLKHTSRDADHIPRVPAGVLSQVENGSQAWTQSRVVLVPKEGWLGTISKKSQCPNLVVPMSCHVNVHQLFKPPGTWQIEHFQSAGKTVA